MRKYIIFLASIMILAPVISSAQQAQGLKPTQTVLLYADSFEGNIDPVYGEETIDDKGTLKNVSDLAILDLYFPENPVSIIADALDVEETIKLNKQ